MISKGSGGDEGIRTLDGLMTCPCPLKLDHLLLSSFDGKVDYYGKKEIFGCGRYSVTASD